MDATRAVAAALAIVAVAGAALPVAAHGWAVVADDQVVGDGTVVVAEVSVLEDAYVALHVDDGGEPGRVVGVTRLEHGEYHGVAVSLNGSFWDDLDGSVDLLAVVHDDDGDGTFEPSGGDAPHEADGEVVADALAVRRGDDGSARLLAGRQETDGTVTVEHVDLPTDGFVVLYADEDGERGAVVGVRHLPAGHHEDVVVDVDPRYFNGESSRLYLLAGLHADDGDGTWEPSADDAITAGGAAITTAFDARKTRATLPTPSPTPSPTPTASPTTTPTDAATASPTVAGTTTDAAAPGFGVAAALAGLAAAALARRARR